jgi:hypothetical protein
MYLQGIFQGLLGFLHTLLGGLGQYIGGGFVVGPHQFGELTSALDRLSSVTAAAYLGNKALQDDVRFDAYKKLLPK